MAQLEKTLRSSHIHNTSKSHETFEQLVRAEETKLSPRDPSPRLGINSDQEEYLTHDKGRKSVLARVKERALRLRHSLSGRRKLPREIDQEIERHRRSSSTYPWGLLQYVNDNDKIENDNNEDELDEDPEYFGAPMYESEAAPESLKENARQHPRAVPVVAEIHKTPTAQRGAVAIESTTSNQINKAASKSTGLTIAAPEAAKVQKTIMGSQTQDKGVSVKEYFMNKLEPGDNERALSQAITDAITPRRRMSSTGNSSSVVQKVKGVVASFLWHQDKPPTNNNNNNNTNNNNNNNATAASCSTNVPSCSLQNSVNARTTDVHYGHIPVSFHVYKGIEEENHGRILQAN